MVSPVDECLLPLARGLLLARGLNPPSRADLADTWAMTLTVLFRLLFIGDAENNGLISRRFLNRDDLAGPFDGACSWWQKLDQIGRAIHEGNADWEMPAWRIDLFERDSALSRIGGLLAGMTLPNSVFVPVLRTLFAHCPTIHVRDFGAIHEGLLDRQLAVDANGDVCLLDRSGARKSAGAWFTPPFVIEHLLDLALAPALKDHLERLDSLDDRRAAERLFDFRVADIAMGAGHFLVAAVERVAESMTAWLACRPRTGIDPRLVRRLIAERCIYGVDLSPRAVSLARLSLWRHTCAPDLPPPALDRNLVVGNSLVDTDWPESSSGERSGFDVILGNPPWQEATVEEHAFWARHRPGLRGLSARRREAVLAALRSERPDLVQQYEEERAAAVSLRRLLPADSFPGMETGDPDLYKAFCWRFWRLVREGGWIGVVLPRSALNAKGSAPFRREILANADPVDLTVLVNNRQWVFRDVHPQYSIALLAMGKRRGGNHRLRLRGPFTDIARFQQGAVRPPAEFAGAEVANWTVTASIPLLPSEESLEVFSQLRRSPRLDLDDPASWRVRPHAELHATNDKGLLDLESIDCPDGFWPVLAGESFDLWRIDTGRSYAWADPRRLIGRLLEKRRRGARRADSPFSGFSSAWIGDPATLPCFAPRIAFRDVTRATDTRTVRCALVPGNVFLANQAPYLLWTRGDEREQAYLLGVLSSLVLDWYARRFVETHLNFFLLEALPIPRPPRCSRGWQRVVGLAGRLAAVDDRFAGWAEKVGVEHGPLSAADKQEHLHELDAVVAQLYGLTEKQLVHLFETFHKGWDHVGRLTATLRCFRRNSLIW
jgi:hypothetical protein